MGGRSTLTTEVTTRELRAVTWPSRGAPWAALEAKAERTARRSAIEIVGASAPDDLNSWLPDQGSNPGPAD
jgi:hypothetical protein